MPDQGDAKTVPPARSTLKNISRVSNLYHPLSGHLFSWRVVTSVISFDCPGRTLYEKKSPTYPWVHRPFCTTGLTTNGARPLL